MPIPKVRASVHKEQALKLLTEVPAGPYAASYAMAEGDVLLRAGRRDEARDAYSRALQAAATDGQGGVNLPVLQQKLQSLSPVPASTLAPAAATAPVVEAAPAEASPEANQPAAEE